MGNSNDISAKPSMLECKRIRIVRMRKELENYRALCSEIESMRAELEKLEQEQETIRDTTKSYTTGKPVTIMIQGRVYTKAFEDKYNALLKNLYMKLADRIAAKAKIEEWIDTLDAEIRTIVRMVYINNMEHEEVASELGYERSSITKKISRFWAAYGLQLSHNSHEKNV